VGKLLYQIPRRKFDFLWYLATKYNAKKAGGNERPKWIKKKKVLLQATIKMSFKPNKKNPFYRHEV